MVRWIIHLDMDAFFAAIEQLDHVQYRGKPVIVGADPGDGYGRGVVSTCSYEARKYGVHSAMPVSQAYKHCPHGIFVRGRHERYAQVSRDMMSILEQFTPIIQKISIDEAFLDVTQSIPHYGSVEKLAITLCDKIFSELRLTASIGVAPNKFIAKIASDLEKPGGMVYVQHGEEKSFLSPLPISKLWGVGKKTEAVLKQMGIDTIGAVASFSEQELSQKLGKWGNALWRLAQGIDNRAVSSNWVQKSISQETTFNEDTNDQSRIEFTLNKLTESLTRLMRKDNLKGRTVTLKLRYEDFTTLTRSKTFDAFIDSSKIIRGVVVTLYRRANKQNRKVRLLGVAMSQLNCVAGEQLSLFEQEDSLNTKLTRLLDSLQNQYGEKTIMRASLLEKTPPDRSDK